MLSTVPSAILLGVQGHPVSVEVHVSAGLPGFTIVGLPDTACREARDRVRAALLSSGLPWPQQRVTVNLAPSALRKSGSGLDLPIAVGLLAALGLITAKAIEGCGFVGELGLDGALRPVPGVVSLVEALAVLAVVVPPPAVAHARLVGGRRILSAPTLRAVVAALRDEEPWSDPPSDPSGRRATSPLPDLADVRGQVLGRRGLEVAAAGGHNLLLIGPPGAGKTLLATRLPGLLPPLGASEALEATRVHSAAGLVAGGDVVDRAPFRAPHHSASAAALLGGGANLRPGEVSLASGGVLFLDELAEFPAPVLDGLRQPLEEGVVRLARARASITLPARFLLVAAMNPCPCGRGGVAGRCMCSEAARARYARRVSGPLLDRFDLRVAVERPRVEDILDGPAGETSSAVAARVAVARSRAVERGVAQNADIPAPRLDELAPLSRSARAVLERRLQLGELSARGLHRVRRVARTVADLAGADEFLSDVHVLSALALRAGIDSYSGLGWAS